MIPSELQSVLERRGDRAAMAASASRRNTPALLLILATVLLVVAAIAVFLAWGARNSALVMVDARIQQARLIQEKGGKIKAARQKLKEVRDSRANAAMSGVPLKLQQICPNEKLQAVLASAPAREQVGGVEGGNVPKRFVYQNIKHDSIADVMAWIEVARREISGLEIDRLQLRPGPNDWTISLTFIRWEKKEN
jgi:hypothetical protein